MRYCEFPSALAPEQELRPQPPRYRPYAVSRFANRSSPRSLVSISRILNLLDLPGHRHRTTRPH
jgi:hypothetical protein